MRRLPFSKLQLFLLWQLIGSVTAFRVAIVGGGPSGLLLSHCLLQKKHRFPQLTIDIFDQRNPKKETTSYAFGIGSRGRSAIQWVSHDLWNTVRRHGYECDRFTVYLPNGLFRFKLRDSVPNQPGSLVLQRCELCRVLLEELERSYKGQFALYSDCTVLASSIDWSDTSIVVQGRKKRQYDLIVGSDGAHSQVRKAIEAACPNQFQSTMEPLPGAFKVVHLKGGMPAKVDPDSLCLLLPSTKCCPIREEKWVSEGKLVWIKSFKANDMERSFPCTPN